MIDHFAAPWTAPDRYALRPDARRFETWESNHAARIGLGVAVDYALALGIEAIGARCRALAGRLRDGLREVPSVTLYDLGSSPAAIVSFALADRPAEAVKAALAAQGINASVSQPASTLLDAAARRLPPLVRASPHCYNSEAEIDSFVAACANLAR